VQPEKWMMRFRLQAVFVCVLTSMAGAVIFSGAAWYLLPYELLERQTPSDRFMLWEGVVWMAGLTLIFFGIAAFFGSTDMFGRTGDPYSNRTFDHDTNRIRHGLAGRHLFTDLPAAPWIMAGIGAALIAGATVSRMLILPE
jgi:hypothetical protein